MNIILGILTVVLILVSLFLILIVLAQPSKSDGSMGSALGGGMTESVFGGEGSSALSKLTINAAVVFFVLSFLLYLGNVYERNHAGAGSGTLPNIAVPAVPVMPTPSTQSAPPLLLKPTPANPAPSPAAPASAAPSSTVPSPTPAKP
jgi:preprotein translocase subunit SecG